MSVYIKTKRLFIPFHFKNKTDNIFFKLKSVFKSTHFCRILTPKRIDSHALSVNAIRVNFKLIRFVQQKLMKFTLVEM